MNTLTFDFETTRFPEGNPFSKHLKAVCLGYKVNLNLSVCAFSLDFPLFDWSSRSTLAIAFNAKFDLHWARRLGYSIPKQIWCCQLAEYILSGQKNTWPSLEETAKKYELSSKLDVVKTEYWDKGIDTDKVPKDILAEYCIQDVELTYAIYLKQLEQFEKRPKLFTLFKIACQDLLVLQEMEWNGLTYNEKLCNERAKQCEEEYAKHSALLRSVYPDLSINFSSGPQLSAFLYGGTITETIKEPVGFFKTGERKGQVKYQNKEITHTLPRLVEPLPKSEMKKEGVFATDADTLKKLKGPAAKKYVGPLLEMSRLEKLFNTYYKGLPAMNKEMNWPDNIIHGQFNQVVTGTGRLSSSKPNLQNFAGEVDDVFVSRFLQ